MSPNCSYFSVVVLNVAVCVVSTNQCPTSPPAAALPWRAGVKEAYIHQSCLRLGPSQVLRSLRHYLRAQLKAKDITPSIAWSRDAWKEEVLGELP